MYSGLTVDHPGLIYCDKMCGIYPGPLTIPFVFCGRRSLGSPQGNGFMSPCLVGLSAPQPLQYCCLKSAFHLGWSPSLPNFGCSGQNLIVCLICCWFFIWIRIIFFNSSFFVRLLEPSSQVSKPGAWPQVVGPKKTSGCFMVRLNFKETTGLRWKFWF